MDHHRFGMIIPCVHLLTYVLLELNALTRVVIDALGLYNLQVKRESAEREALGALPLYQRTLP